uniref:3-oxo-5-alpha-steroid 4-dehydrogenase C-terminal domain-containing protein n=1 Tax=Amorphochlora amoebiformis TaxID=1561963 RepID=A0A7S0GX38_9EUKA
MLVVRAGFWGMITLCWVSVFIPVLRSFSRYGKLASGAEVGNGRRAMKLFNHPALYIPSSLGFKLFYTWLLIFNSLLLVEVSYLSYSGKPLCILAILYAFDQPCSAQPQLEIHSLTVSVLLEFHAVRRVYECWKVHRFSGTSMQHVTVSAGGIAFYILAALSPLVDPGVICPLVPRGKLWPLVPGILLFLVGSYHQHKCHKILAQLRRGPERRYGVPFGDWFQIVSCPHYLSEIIIYASFAVISETATQWVCVLWVASNLVITGLRTHHWYIKKFPGYQSLGRKAIIPFLI